MAVMFAARRRLVCVCGGESVQRLPRLGAVMFVLAYARPKRKGPGGALLLERYAALHHGINLKQRARAASLPCSLPARPDQAWPLPSPAIGASAVGVAASAHI